MYVIESILHDKLIKQIENIAKDLGYEGDASFNEDLCQTEDYIEVWITTYYGREASDNHIHLVKIPWSYIFNLNFEKDIEQDKIKEKEIAEFKRLQAKYGHII